MKNMNMLISLFLCAVALALTPAQSRAAAPERKAVQSSAGAESSTAIVIATCKDAACATKAVDEYRADPILGLTLAEGYPRTLTSADAPELGAGVWVVALGLCKSDPKLSRDDKEHYPELTTRRLKIAAPAAGCVTKKKGVAPMSATPLSNDDRFGMRCPESSCSVWLKSKDGPVPVLTVEQMVVDRLMVTDAGALLELRAGCGTSCSASYFVDPLTGRHSDSKGNVYASETNKRILVRGAGDALVVEPIFDWAADKRFQIKRAWAMNAEESILSCKFLPRNKLRIFYYSKNGTRTREIIDLPAEFGTAPRLGARKGEVR